MSLYFIGYSSQKKSSSVFVSVWFPTAASVQYACPRHGEEELVLELAPSPVENDLMMSLAEMQRGDLAEPCRRERSCLCLTKMGVPACHIAPESGYR